jgi:hypothetical protein
VSLLHAGGLEVFQYYLRKVALLPIVPLGIGHDFDQFVVFVDGQHAVRGEAFDGEWSGPATRTFFLSA